MASVTTRVGPFDRTIVKPRRETSCGGMIRGEHTCKTSRKQRNTWHCSNSVAHTDKRGRGRPFRLRVFDTGNGGYRLDPYGRRPLSRSAALHD